MVLDLGRSVGWLVGWSVSGTVGGLVLVACLVVLVRRLVGVIHSFIRIVSGPYGWSIDHSCG